MEISVTDNEVVIKIRVSAILLTLFVLYCILEVLRVAYIGGLEALPLSIVLLVFGAFNVARLQKHLARNRATASECGHLFSTKPTKVVMAFHVASIVLILSAITVLLVDFPSFLMIQLLLLANLWLDNRRSNVSLNMLKASFIFTVIYVSYISLLTKNAFIELIALIYFASWLYLQIKIDQPVLREGKLSSVASLIGGRIR